MKIACIGWGSLIWRPENLLIVREWFHDGPILPVEFVRQSKDGRLTLVIYTKAKPVRTLWALMSTPDLETAKVSLLIREGIPEKRLNTLIDSVTVSEETDDQTKLIVQEWIMKLKLDAAIWTNLSPKFEGNDNRILTFEEAITYLKSLDINSRNHAEEYIRMTPKQIDTEYRRKFESEFGWTNIER